MNGALCERPSQDAMALHGDTGTSTLSADEMEGRESIAIPRIDTTRPVAFTYDGTLEGLMSATFMAYAAHCDPQDVSRVGHVQPRLGQQVVDIQTNMDIALRVRRGICRTCGDAVWNTIACASAADGPQVGTDVYRFIRFAMDRHEAVSCTGCARKSTCTVPCSHPRAHGILDEWANPAVQPVLQLQRHVANEVEKMEQFIRFQHVGDDLWFAKCNPNASVVPLVMEWFARRFNTQRFVIYDEVHHLAGISQAGGWQLVVTDHFTPPAESNDEARMQAAWKRFYDALAIDARYNPELRRHFMPERLWRNITEMQPQRSYQDQLPVAAQVQA